MSSGAAAVTTSWTRSAMPRSGSGIFAMASRMSRSPSSRSAAGSRLDEAFFSRAPAFIADFSASLHTLAGRSPAVFVSVICGSPFGVGRGEGAGSGRHRVAGLGGLEDPDPIAERIPDAHVGPIEVVGGLLGEVRHAALLERLVQGAAIVRLERNPADRALGD